MIHGTRKLLVPAMVKTAFAYLQSCERERGPRPEQRRQRLPLLEQPVGPVFPRARAEKASVSSVSPLVSRGVEGKRRGWRGAPDGEEMRAVRGVYGRIDLVSSSSIDHTLKVL